MSGMAIFYPDHLTRSHILDAIRDLDAHVKHRFGPSTTYDLVHEGKHYPPKAVYGLAAGKLTGKALGPKDFKAGARALCFRILQRNGFLIILKRDVCVYPDQVEASDPHTEGSVSTVLVNRFERSLEARSKCVLHYGFTCQVCGFDFEEVYGEIGKDFVHVHHLLELSSIRASYIVNPYDDLVPVCPNCHAMLHKRKPAYTIDELKGLMQSV